MKVKYQAVIQRKESLEDVLTRIETLYDEGLYEKAFKELQRARARFPENLTLMEWEAIFCADENRFREALELLDRVLAADPDRPFALREKAAVLQGLGRFEDSLETYKRVGPDGEEDAAYYFEVGVCQDHLNLPKEADRSFSKAARIEPDHYRAPLRLSQAEFEELVGRALEKIPAKLRRFLENVLVTVMDYPASADPDPFLLGIYQGVPRTERDQESRNHLDRIIIFKRNLEIEFADRETLEEEVRKTVVHEVAHHFGLEEEEMGEYA